jgi:hypothetical protein
MVCKSFFTVLFFQETFQFVYMCRNLKRSRNDYHYIRFFLFSPGLPDFSLYNISKRGKYQKDHQAYQIAKKYTKWSENWTNCLKIFQHLPLFDPPKFTQIGSLGLKLYHLVILIQPHERFLNSFSHKKKFFLCSFICPSLLLKSMHPMYMHVHTWVVPYVWK